MSQSPELDCLCYKLENFPLPFLKTAIKLGPKIHYVVQSERHKPVQGAFLSFLSLLGPSTLLIIRNYCH